MNLKYLLALLMIVPQMLVAQNPLFVPPVLNGPLYNLNLQTGSVSFFQGTPTQTFGVNGNILGPTLIMHQGDSVTMQVNNMVGDTTTLHWHGMHVAPHNDGGPHTVILPGAVWSPTFVVRNEASTHWYHPHLHHKTNQHVSKGLAGLIIVRDTNESNLNLPRTYGQDDFPLVLQTKDFDTANQIVVVSNNDDVMMVNATINPVLSIPAQVVRFRVLNGSSQRVFNLGLSNNTSFYHIGSDAGLLNAPVPLTRLILAPGERAEILINASALNGQTIYLMSYAAELPNGMYGATYPGMGPGLVMNGYNPNPLNGTNFNVLQLNVGAPTATPITSIPTTLNNNILIPAAQANTTRTLTFMPAQMGPNQLNGDFMINNAMFDMNVINYTIPLNNTEIWSLTNNSGISHPFHIHDVSFYILDRNGVPPAASEQGKKDVVLVKPQEVVRFITQFTDFSDPMIPYMYHCHMLTHEDGGMLGQFIVAGPNAVSTTTSIENKVSLYPNPTSSFVYIRLAPSENNEWKARVVSVTGQTLSVPFSKQGNVGILRLDELAQGLYLIEISSTSRRHCQFIQKQ